MAQLRLLLVFTWTLVSALNPAKIADLRKSSPDAKNSSASKAKSWWVLDEDYTDGSAVAQAEDEETVYGDEGFLTEDVDLFEDMDFEDIDFSEDLKRPGVTPRSPQCNLASSTTTTAPEPPTPPTNTLPVNPKPSGCLVSSTMRERCGGAGISATDCKEKDCCFDEASSSCFYPMDECTKDRQFVFAIYKDHTTSPLDPTDLSIPGTSCSPVIVTNEFAVFRFSVNDCGTHHYRIGKTLIFMAEVQTHVVVRNLKYGAITRDDPIRFLIECQYGEGDQSGKQLASVGVMVKTPQVHPLTPVAGKEMFSLDLRIAKDETYKEFYPHNSQPLKVLLKQLVYLEVKLLSKTTDATVKINYCLAYPRPATKALVLVYEGCANPLDAGVDILYLSEQPTNRHTRRFTVKAFQFMGLRNTKFLDEEIYFMCSAELCMDFEKQCEKRCFDGKVR